MVNGAAFVTDYLEHVVGLLGPSDLTDTLEAAREVMTSVRDNGSKVMLAGNGASASIASHFALDFTKQAGIPSVSFNDAPLLTAYANDFGYEHWVAKAVTHHGREGDAVILISTSGRSTNMVNAAEVSRDLGIEVLTFTGHDRANPLRELGDVNFWADSRAYNVVEGVHAIWLGLLCDLIIGKREYDVSG